MAKEEVNKLQRRDNKREFETIFSRIETELFAKDFLDLAVKNDCKKELEALQKAVSEFKQSLLLDDDQEKDYVDELFAARTLQKSFNQFFDRTDLDKKHHVVMDFWHTVRGARFSRRTKTLVASIIGGLFFLGGSLGLIIGTGGIALIGMGAVIGVSFALGFLGGVGSAIAEYFFAANEHEYRGKEVRDALLELDKCVGLITFCTARMRTLCGRASNESELSKQMKKKYNRINKGNNNSPQIIQLEETENSLQTTTQQEGTKKPSMWTRMTNVLTTQPELIKPQTEKTPPEIKIQPPEPPQNAPKPPATSTTYFGQKWKSFTDLFAPIMQTNQPPAPKTPGIKVSSYKSNS